MAGRHLLYSDCESWLYLAAIKDMATRQIVGWSMADHLKADLCIDALVMALQRCQPKKGLTHHSDRGVQDDHLSPPNMLRLRIGLCWSGRVSSSQ